MPLALMLRIYFMQWRSRLLEAGRPDAAGRLRGALPDQPTRHQAKFPARALTRHQPLPRAGSRRARVPRGQTPVGIRRSALSRHRQEPGTRLYDVCAGHSVLDAAPTGAGVVCPKSRKWSRCRAIDQQLHRPCAVAVRFRRTTRPETLLIQSFLSLSSLPQSPHLLGKRRWASRLPSTNALKDLSEWGVCRQNSANGGRHNDFARTTGCVAN